jgi:hypothetical protein
LFATGICKDWVTESKDLNGFLGNFGHDNVDRLRAGILDERSWARAVKLIWKDIAGISDVQAMRVPVCKVLFESLFQIWKSRHDVTVFL